MLAQLFFQKLRPNCLNVNGKFRKNRNRVWWILFKNSCKLGLQPIMLALVHTVNLFSLFSKQQDNFIVCIG